MPKNSSEFKINIKFFVIFVEIPFIYIHLFHEICSYL